METVVYSRFKSTALFYNAGVHIFEFTDLGFENVLLKIKTPKNTEHVYKITSIDQNQKSGISVVHMVNLNSGVQGVWKMMPYGKAELSFGASRVIHLKV